MELYASSDLTKSHHFQVLAVCVYRSCRSCTTPAALGLTSLLQRQLCSYSQCSFVCPTSHCMQPLFANAAYRAACNIDWAKQQQSSANMSTVDGAKRHLRTSMEQPPSTLQYSAAENITNRLPWTALKQAASHSSPVDAFPGVQQNCWRQRTGPGQAHG